MCRKKLPENDVHIPTYEVGSIPCQCRSEAVEMPSYSESCLISGYIGERYGINKRLIDYDRNLKFLIGTVEEVLRRFQHSILDGYFCILGNKN